MNALRNSPGQATLKHKVWCATKANFINFTTRRSEAVGGSHESRRSSNAQKTARVDFCGCAKIECQVRGWRVLFNPHRLVYLNALSSVHTHITIDLSVACYTYGCGIQNLLPCPLTDS